MKELAALFLLSQSNAKFKKRLRLIRVSHSSLGRRNFNSTLAGKKFVKLQELLSNAYCLITKSCKLILTSYFFSFILLKFEKSNLYFLFFQDLVKGVEMFLEAE